MLKVQGYSSEDWGFKFQRQQAATISLLSKDLNPLSSRGAVSWLTARFDPNFVMLVLSHLVSCFNFRKLQGERILYKNFQVPCNIGKDS